MIAMYLRVSTTRQETRLQLAAMLDWLKAQGLSRTGVHWFRDKGAASDAKSRPAWDRLITEIRARRVERLVCWKMDRINRWSAKDHLRLRLELDDLGVEVTCLTEPDSVRFADVLDILREAMRAEARAEWLKTHRDRIRAGVRLSIAKHGTWGHTRTNGTKLNQAALAAMRQERAAGAKLGDLAAKYGVSKQTVSQRCK